jgi:hypothetical protein
MTSKATTTIDKIKSHLDKIGKDAKIIRDELYSIGKKRSIHHEDEALKEVQRELDRKIRAISMLRLFVVDYRAQSLGNYMHSLDDGYFE